MQTDASTKESLGNLFMQTNSMATDFLANMQPETREMFDQIYAQTRSNAYSWLEEAQPNTRETVNQMLTQTSFGNYFTQTCVEPEVVQEMTNFFGQFEAVEIDEQSMLVQLETEVMDAELEDAAAYLAQLSTEEMETLNTLVQSKNRTAKGELKTR